MKVPHHTTGFRLASTTQLGQSSPREQLPCGRKEGKVTMEADKNWLADGWEGERKQEKEETMGAAREGTEELMGERKMKFSCKPLWVFHMYIHI